MAEVRITEMRASEDSSSEVRAIEVVMWTHESGSKYREEYLSAIAFILEKFNIKPVEEVTKDEQPF